MALKDQIIPNKIFLEKQLIKFIVQNKKNLRADRFKVMRTYHFGVKMANQIAPNKIFFFRKNNNIISDFLGPFHCAKL